MTTATHDTCPHCGRELTMVCEGGYQLHIKPSIYTLWPEYDLPEWEEVIR